METPGTGARRGSVASRAWPALAIAFFCALLCPPALGEGGDGPDIGALNTFDEGLYAAHRDITLAMRRACGSCLNITVGRSPLVQLAMQGLMTPGSIVNVPLASTFVPAPGREPVKYGAHPLPDALRVQLYAHFDTHLLPQLRATRAERLQLVDFVHTANSVVPVGVILREYLRERGIRQPLSLFVFGSGTGTAVADARAAGFTEVASHSLDYRYEHEGLAHGNIVDRVLKDFAPHGSFVLGQHERATPLPHFPLLRAKALAVMLIDETPAIRDALAALDARQMARTLTASWDPSRWRYPEFRALCALATREPAIFEEAGVRAAFESMLARNGEDAFMAASFLLQRGQMRDAATASLLRYLRLARATTWQLQHGIDLLAALTTPNEAARAGLTAARTRLATVETAAPGGAAGDRHYRAVRAEMEARLALGHSVPDIVEDAIRAHSTALETGNGIVNPKERAIGEFLNAHLSMYQRLPPPLEQQLRLARAISTLALRASGVISSSDVERFANQELFQSARDRAGFKAAFLAFADLHLRPGRDFERVARKALLDYHELYAAPGVTCNDEAPPTLLLELLREAPAHERARLSLLQQFLPLVDATLQPGLVVEVLRLLRERSSPHAESFETFLVRHFRDNADVAQLAVEAAGRFPRLRNLIGAIDPCLANLSAIARLGQRRR